MCAQVGVCTCENMMPCIRTGPLLLRKKFDFDFKEIERLSPVKSVFKILPFREIRTFINGNVYKRYSNSFHLRPENRCKQCSRFGMVWAGQGEGRNT